MKYLITLWKDSFDCDGIFSQFFVLYKTHSKEDAVKQVPVLWREEAAKELKKYHYFPMPIAERNKPGYCIEPYKPPNANNEVIQLVKRKLGDGSGYNHTYFYFEVIELPDSAMLSPELFEDSNEVRDCFNRKSEWLQNEMNNEAFYRIFNKQSKDWSVILMWPGDQASSEVSDSQTSTDSRKGKMIESSSGRSHTTTSGIVTLAVIKMILLGYLFMVFYRCL